MTSLFRYNFIFQNVSHLCLHHGHRLPQHMLPVVAMVTVLTMLPFYRNKFMINIVLMLKHSPQITHSVVKTFLESFS